MFLLRSQQWRSQIRLSSLFALRIGVRIDNGNLIAAPVMCSNPLQQRSITYSLVPTEVRFVAISDAFFSVSGSVQKISTHLIFFALIYPTQQRPTPDLSLATTSDHDSESLSESSFPSYFFCSKQDPSTQPFFLCNSGYSGPNQIAPT